MMTATPISTPASILTNNININKRSSAHLSDDDNVSTSSSITANFNTPAHSSEDVKDGAGSKRQSLRIKSHEAPSKPKRKRISQEQFQKLTELFEQTDTPNYELREKLAIELNMTNREVQVWFQNRRAKYNRARQQEQQRNQQLALQKHYHYTQSHHQYQLCRDEMLIYAHHSSYQQPHHRYHYYDMTQQQQQQQERRWQDDTSQNYSRKQQQQQRQQEKQKHKHKQQVHHYQDPCDSYSSTSSSSSSNVSTPTSPYPTLSPNMAPLEILAMAADYIQRFDQEEKIQRRQQQEYAANKKRRLDELHESNSRRSWRPWL